MQIFNYLLLKQEQTKTETTKSPILSRPNRDKNQLEMNKHQHQSKIGYGSNLITVP